MNSDCEYILFNLSLQLSAQFNIIQHNLALLTYGKYIVIILQPFSMF